jgi:hypothetical protein
VTTIKRRNHGRGHSYVDEETGAKIPGVTTITSKGLPKDALMKWVGDVTADYALDHWEELGAMTPSQRLNAMKKGRYADRDAAASRGRQVHKLAERLVGGETVAIPEEIRGHVESYVRFLDEWGVEPEYIEACVWHPDHRYCGTLDLICTLTDPDEPDQRLRALVDIKTSRSGVFGENALQLVGYRKATWIVLPGGELVPMPEVDFTAVVHVRPNGYELVPVIADDDEFRVFLYVQQIAQWLEGARDLVGEPLIPPTTSTYRLTVA